MIQALKEADKKRVATGRDELHPTLSIHEDHYVQSMTKVFNHLFGKTGLSRMVATTEDIIKDKAKTAVSAAPPAGGRSHARGGGDPTSEADWIEFLTKPERAIEAGVFKSEDHAQLFSLARTILSEHAAAKSDVTVSHGWLCVCVWLRHRVCFARCHGSQSECDNTMRMHRRLCIALALVAQPGRLSRPRRPLWRWTRTIVARRFAPPLRCLSARRWRRPLTRRRPLRPDRLAARHPQPVRQTYQLRAAPPSCSCPRISRASRPRSASALLPT